MGNIEQSVAFRGKSPERTMVYQYIHREDGKIQCPHCEFANVHQSTVHMHITAKHSGAFKHKCTKCSSEFAQKQLLTNHIQSKHPELLEKPVKSYNCPCSASGCTHTFLHKRQVRSHYLLKHCTKEMDTLFVKEDLSCSACKVKFNSKPHFTYHAVHCLPVELRRSKEIVEGLGIPYTV